jgi:hypothetical protein
MMMMIAFVLNQHVLLDFHRASLQKQLSTGRLMPLCRHIIQTSNQSAYALNSLIVSIKSRSSKYQFYSSLIDPIKDQTQSTVLKVSLLIPLVVANTLKKIPEILSLVVFYMLLDVDIFRMNLHII